MCTRLFARANDVKIMRSRDGQCNAEESPLQNIGSNPGVVLPIMAYTGRLLPKGVPFSGFRYKKG